MKKKREYRKIELKEETGHLFGENLRKILKDKKIKQAELARMMNTSPQQISQYVNAEWQPSIKKIFEFADVLDVQPIEFLITGEAIKQLSTGRKLLGSDKLAELFKVSEKLDDEQLNALTNIAKQL